MGEFFEKIASRILLIATLFLVVGQIGLAIDSRLVILNEALPKWAWAQFLTSADDIHALWAGLLAAHAAVGAIAPLLGYTLFTTTVTSASRIAPVGAVVASEIRWREYLAVSLSLLISSLITYIFAPSSLGLLAAGAAAVYVTFRTAQTFLQGFQLLENPAKLDKASREYLARLLPKIPASPADKDLAKLNTLYVQLPSWSGESGPYALLCLGQPSRSTEFIRTGPMAISRLQSEVARYGGVLCRVENEIPVVLHGRVPVFGISVAEEAVDGTDGLKGSMAREVDPATVERIQTLLNSLVVFSSGPITDEMARFPLLANRHIEAVLFQAVPNHQPHDFKYALDVLGDLIDKATSSADFEGLRKYGALDWVTDAPPILVEQVGVANIGKRVFVSELARFMRRRVVRWLEAGNIELARVYMHWMARLLRDSIARADEASSSYVSLIIREIPSIVGNISHSGVRVVVKPLIELAVDPMLRPEDMVSARALLMQTLDKSVPYQFRDSKGELYIEIFGSILALLLFQASQGASVTSAISEVVEHFSNLRLQPGGAATAAHVARSQELISVWEWEWWESRAHGEGVHSVTIETWMRRALLILLRDDFLTIRRADGSKLPSMQVLTQIRDDVMNADTWGAELELPPELIDKLRRLGPVLGEAIASRSEFVKGRIDAANLDLALVGRYVSDVAEEIRSSFGDYARWMYERGCVVVLEETDPRQQAGVGHLVPREWFVDAAALDIPVHLIAPSVGSALREYELEKLVVGLTAGVPSELASTSSDDLVWDKIRQTIDDGTGSLLIIGRNIGKFEVFERLRNLEDSAAGLSIRFETVYRNDDKCALFVIDPVGNLRINRYKPQIEGGSLVEEPLSEEDGRVMVRLAEISQEMMEQWLEGESPQRREELRASYAESLIFQVAWSSSVDFMNFAKTLHFQFAETRHA